MGNQPSQPKITAQDKAIYQLKRQRDNLKQYSKRINVVMDRQTALAKQAVQDGKLEKAKIYLRSKKQQQSIVSSTYAQLETLEGLIGTIEFKLIEKDVIYGLSQGNEVLKKLNSEMSVEKIDRVMDDLEDEVLKVDEVSDILGAGLTNAEEHEVDDELEALELEVTGKSGKTTVNPQPEDIKAKEEIKLPDAPSTVPESKPLPQKVQSKSDLKGQSEERKSNEPIAA
ncbi:hypothetical protein JCM33374_g1731 [Metschnikowia sp. JCM 33374]|nr:hypothetical protein JCM33374_g1731 [Metschnikowia sp. JCM 33374]